jgi:hypothetical protein
MINDTLASIEELQRIPSPCPAPQALACDGTDLWVGSGETQRLYGVRSKTGAVFEEATAPGDPIGMTVMGDSLRIVCSEGEDDSRFIRRYVFGHGFKSSEAVPCPFDTGSFLAYDGDNIFLSQRFERRILEIETTGHVKRMFYVPREITGMVIVNGCFFLMTTESRTSDDYRLLRVDARKEEPVVTELAGVPFWGRSLAWDGSKFWTNCRKENTIVAFAPLGVT